MTHQDEGRFAAKRDGAPPDPKIAGPLNDRLTQGRLGCPAASKLATDLGVPMAAVGETADKLEVKIVRCQLGLFGYETADSRDPAYGPAADVPDDLAAELRDRARGRHVDCLVLWEIADGRGRSRMAVACAAEALGMKIAACQLGAF